MPIFIAVIDDDRSYQLVTKKFLKASGHPHRLLQFYDGLEAISYFEVHSQDEKELPDIIFLDINMPYMDGWQFLDRLATLPMAKKSLTIYMVTSSVSPVDLGRAASYKNLAGYEVKPVTKERISQIIENAIKGA